MDHVNVSELPDVTTMIRLTQSILSNLNVGLLVYYLKDPDEATSLTLVYANDEASHYTRADLQKLVGKKILDAFPSLAKTELPQNYAAVARDGKPREFGAVEYEDNNVEKSVFSVKAFPMPNRCVGVVFENISLRKKVETMARQLHDQLKQKNKAQENLVATLLKDLKAPAYDVRVYAEMLQKRAEKRLHDEERGILDNLVAVSQRLNRIVDDLRSSAEGG